MVASSAVVTSPRPIRNCSWSRRRSTAASAGPWPRASPRSREHGRGVDVFVFVFVFVDSDSLVEPDALRRMVAYFDDPAVGAVAGHADVWNRDTNLLTRMQAVRYYVAFRVDKSAEALFGSVTCCSGCFSGYRAAVR